MIPEFSPDGRLLEWTERTKSPKFLSPNRFAGFWVINVADFNVSQDGTPSLSDIRAVSPPGDAMNETGGFSADSSSLVFTSDFENHNFWHNQIPPRPQVRCNRATHPRRQLQRASPLHTRRAGVVDVQRRQPVTRHRLVDDESDGSNPQCLSDFNAGNANAIGHKPVYATVVQTANWCPDNSYFYADVETNLLNSDSVIARVALTCHGC